MKDKRVLDRLAGCYYLFVRDRKNVVWVDRGIIKRTKSNAIVCRFWSVAQIQVWWRHLANA
jgi:hypothetical protein